MADIRNITTDFAAAALMEWVGELGQETEEVWKGKGKVSEMRKYW